MGILTVIFIASTSGVKSGAHDTKRQSDLKQIQLSLAIYYEVNRAYPASLSTLVSGGFLPSPLPSDPVGSGAYEYLASGTNNSTYCLGTTLESAIPSDSASCTSQSSGSTANYKVQPPK